MPKITKKFVKIARTTNLYLSFFALGLCIAVPGPTLLDLQKIVNTDTKHIAFVYTCRSTGYLLGSLIGGIAFDLVKNKQPLLIVLNFLMSMSSIATPWCRSLGTLTTAMAGGGIVMGAIDTGSNVLCLNIWGKESPPYFQALHFAFGLGGFVAPLIAAPFLSPETFDEILNFTDTDTVANVSSNTSIRYALENPNNNVSLPQSNSIPSITYAYSIIGVFCFLVTLLFVLDFIIAPNDDNASNDNKTENVVDPGSCYTYIVVILTCSLLTIYAGIEIGFSQMISTYAVKGNLKLSKTTGSYLTSVLWGAFTFSRGASIFLSIRFSCLTLLLADLVVIMLSGVLLLTLGVSYEICLWIGTAILGVGIASCYPTVISWVENYITVSNKIASTFILGAAFGEMIVPLAISQFIETVPEVLFYAVLSSGLLCCVLLFTLQTILKKKGEKYISNVKSEGECNLGMDESKI